MGNVNTGSSAQEGLEKAICRVCGIAYPISETTNGITVSAIKSQSQTVVKNFEQLIKQLDLINALFDSSYTTDEKEIESIIESISLYTEYLIVLKKFHSVQGEGETLFSASELKEIMEFLKGESNSNIWEIHKSKSFLGITQEQLKKFAEQSNSNLKETIVFKIAFSTNLKKLYDEIIKINNDTIIANCIKNIIGISNEVTDATIKKVFQTIGNKKITKEKSIPIFRIFLLCPNFLNYQSKLFPILAEQTPENLLKIENFFSKSENVEYSQDKNVIFYIIENNLLDGNVPDIEIIKLAIQIKKKTGKTVPQSILYLDNGGNLMRDILKAQNEAKFLIELLLSQNIEIYTIYQTFIDFQREVKESLEFFQTCHPNYKELQDFATESFENQQRLADTHLENAKTLLEEASEYINFNRRLLANKKEKMELLNRLYSILDPNFNTENLFKVLENIWTFNGKIEEIIKLFKDFKIDNYDLFLDKDTLSKILNYPDLYNFKGEPISDVLEFITLEEKENKQYPTKETSEQPLGKKKPKNSIPNNQINEVNTPKATLTPNNEIDTIIVNAIDSGDEKEMERIGELINETFKKRKAFFKHYGRTSSTTNKSSGTGCGTTLNKFLNRYLNKFIKTYSNESYSDYLRRISNISFEDFNEIGIDERIKEFNNTPGIFFAKLQDLEECLIIYGRIHKLKLESLITNYGGLLSDFKTLFERKA